MALKEIYFKPQDVKLFEIMKSDKMYFYEQGLYLISLLRLHEILDQRKVSFESTMEI